MAKKVFLQIINILSVVIIALALFVLLSVVLFQTIATGLNIMKVNSYVVIALYGVLLLFAVVGRRRKA